MNTKHTPGPLEVCTATAGEEYPNGDITVYLIEREGTDSAEVLGSAYREEDAILWAAAPELLAALQEIATRADSNAQEQDPNSEAHAGFIRLRDDARAAIAKAEGR